MMNLFKNIKSFTVKNSRIKILIMISTTVVLLFLLITLINLISRKNSIGEGSSQDFKTRARITNGKELFSIINGGVTYDQLSDDLFVYGKYSYADYQKNGNTVVNFTINNNTLTKKDSVVYLEGKFLASPNTLKISVQLLDNSRIKTSIVDPKTNKNIDSVLPSNSKRNQFISTLPIAHDDFVVGYNISSDKFYVSSYSGSKNTNDNIKKFLEDSIGTDIIAKENYTIYELTGSDSNN